MLSPSFDEVASIQHILHVTVQSLAAVGRQSVYFSCLYNISVAPKCQSEVFATENTTDAGALALLAVRHGTAIDIVTIERDKMSNVQVFVACCKCTYFHVHIPENV